MLTEEVMFTGLTPTAKPQRATTSRATTGMDTYILKTHTLIQVDRHKRSIMISWGT